jgi:NhaP-type Na+/H+ or K+/H+ antiporter
LNLSAVGSVAAADEASNKARVPNAFASGTRAPSLPRRLQVLLEGESLRNDGSGLVLFRFALAAAATGAFSTVGAVGTFPVLAAGGAGGVLGFAWVRLILRLRDDYHPVS